MALQVSEKTNKKSNSFLTFYWRTLSIHCVAYFLAGITAVFTFNYEKNFGVHLMDTLMRPITSPMISLGLILQVITGSVLAFILYPIRNELIDNIKTGWFKLFLIVTGFSFFSPQTPGPGNLEGFIYTKIPWQMHLLSIPEILIYSLLLSVGITFWYKFEKTWIQTISIIGVILIFLMGLLGYLDSLGILPKT